MAPKGIATSAGRRPYLLGIACAAALVVAGGGSALAAPGDLDPAGCIKSNGKTFATQCPTSADGLQPALAVAVSPDGKSVYTVGQNTLSTFERSSSTGALTPAGCIADDAGPEPCASSTDALAGARAVTVSPDGGSVYVSAPGDDALAIFARDLTTGALTPSGCVEDPGGPEPCAVSSEGLNSGGEIVISPDGASLYAAGASAVLRFTRNTSTGALTPGGCIGDDEAAAFTPCGQTADGLGGTDSMVMSPDGAWLYVVGAIDDALVALPRDLENGRIAPGACIDDNDTGPEPCPQSIDAFHQPTSVAISPDGKSVYVAVIFDSNAVVSFSRASSGALTPQGCIVDDDGGSDSCAASAAGLSGANAVVVSPDGHTVYVGALGDDTVAKFGRDTSTGGLTPQGCVIEDWIAPADSCAQSSDGLADINGLAISGDGTTLYVVSNEAVTWFERGEILDGSLPKTEMTKKPEKIILTKKKKQKFEFRFKSSEPGSTFRCRFDDRPWKSCSSPYEGRASHGRHTFAVVAVDAAGNQDPTPARASWNVKPR